MSSFVCVCVCVCVCVLPAGSSSFHPLGSTADGSIKKRHCFINRSVGKCEDLSPTHQPANCCVSIAPGQSWIRKVYLILPLLQHQHPPLSTILHHHPSMPSMLSPGGYSNLLSARYWNSISIWQIGGRPIHHPPTRHPALIFSLIVLPGLQEHVLSFGHSPAAAPVLRTSGRQYACRNSQKAPLFT